MRVLFSMAAIIVMLSACNTVEGMGRDIRGAGEAISGSAEKTKEKMR